MALRGYKALCENPYFDALVTQLDEDFNKTINGLLEAVPGVLTADVVFQLLGEARGYKRLKNLLRLFIEALEDAKKQQEKPEQTNEDQTELPFDA